MFDQSRERQEYDKAHPGAVAEQIDAVEEGTSKKISAGTSHA
jgi:hypothetical protein